MHPRKTFIKDLVGSDISSVWIFGKIEQTVGADIIIINDGTSRAKVTECSSANRQSSTTPITKGLHCCVIGLLLKNKALPEIQAKKIINFKDSHIQEAMWNLEVQEINLLLEGKIEPSLE